MSVIDYRRKRLAPTIWEGDKLRPQVRSYLLGLAKKNFPGMIDSFILGSITTKLYSNASDVDINIVMPKSVGLEPYREIARALGKERIKYPGSPHVITFFVVHPVERKDAIEKTTGAYSLTQNTWLKRADNIGTDTKPMEGAFQGQIKDVDIALGELTRDVKDVKLIIDAFKEVPDSEKQRILQDLEDKKDEIEQDLKAVVDEYDELHTARVKSFEKELDSDPHAANKHLYNQTLPGNVIFKMMERYGYRDLLERLRDIYKSLPQQSAGGS
jgi:hypothetical protein